MSETQSSIVETITRSRAQLANEKNVVIAKLQQLETNVHIRALVLKIGSLSSVETDALYHLLVSSTHHITKLDISELQIVTSDYLRIIDALKHNQTLTDLCVGIVDHVVMRSLCDLLCKHESIKKLCVQHSDGTILTTSDIQQIASLPLQALSITDTSGGGLSNQHVYMLCITLRENTHISELNVNGNQITNTSARYLADLLRVNHTLKIIDVRNNLIGETGYRFLANGVSENVTLVKLNELDITWVFENGKRVGLIVSKDDRQRELMAFVMELIQASVGIERVQFESKMLLKMDDIPILLDILKYNDSIRSFELSDQQNQQDPTIRWIIDDQLRMNQRKQIQQTVEKQVFKHTLLSELQSTTTSVTEDNYFVVDIKK